MIYNRAAITDVKEDGYASNKHLEQRCKRSYDAGAGRGIAERLRSCRALSSAIGCRADAGTIAAEVPAAGQASGLLRVAART
jgi:hypothetical protein